MNIGEKLSALTAELTRQRVAVEAHDAKLREAIDALRREFELAVVAPLPRWSDRLDVDAGNVASMEDVAFAKLRTGITRERDLVKRVAAQAALVRVVVGAIAEKRKRVKALDERIKAAPAKPTDAEQNELAVALRRRAFIVEDVKVLRRRMNAVVGDFARSRKTLLSRMVTLTTEVAAVVPESDDYIKSAFSVDAGNIENSLRLLDESEAQLKTGSRSKFAGISELKGRAK